MQLDLLTSSFLEAPARVSPSPASASDWMTRVVTWRSSAGRLFIESVPVGSSLKTSLASSHLILDGTSGRSLPPSLVIPPDLFSAPQMEDGETLDTSTKPKEGTASLGECWTHNSAEWTAIPEQFPSDDGVCSLSDILETGDVPQRYYLSAKACQGILRRAAKRGKELPPQLAAALQAVAGLGTDFDLDGGLVSNTLSAARGAAAATQAVANPLTARMHKGVNTTMDEGQTMVAMAIQERAISENPDAGPDGVGVRYATESDVAQTMQAAGLGTERGGNPNAIPHTISNWRVRRLTPTECERLQAMADGYTDVPWRGKNWTPDGPRYKALGNSMSVNVMSWLGQRIQKVVDLDVHQQLTGEGEML